MSDLCLYELEDNVWDEFGESDDHIVPHHGKTHGDQSPIEVDGCKKRQNELIGVTSNANTITEYCIRGKEKRNLPAVTNNNTMLEKGSWSHTPDGVFPSCDTDSMKEVTSIASDDIRMSTHSFKSSNVESGGCEFCADDPIMGDGCTVVDNNAYCYPLSQVPQTGNDMSFFDNDNEDKENGDLLYYTWPDIGNFEDVDRMFRNCDSTFGIESLNNNEELCWFSSSNGTEGSENTLKSGLKFSGSNAGSSKDVSDHREAFKPDNVGHSNKKNGSVGNGMCSQSTDADDPAALSQISFLNGVDTKSESGNILMPKEQINLCKKQPKQQTKTEEEEPDQYLESGTSFQGYNNLKQFTDMKHSHGELCSQVYSTPSIQQHNNQSTGSDSMNYVKPKLPYMHLEYAHHSDQISVCPTPSGTKSENDGRPSPSLKESSFTSNQLQSMEGSHAASIETPAITMSGKREKLHGHQGFQSSYTANFENTASTSPMVFSGAASNQKQINQSESQIEGQSDVEGASIEIPAELDSSNVQESSCMSSVLDDISLEATSFRQLQQVMGKLDVRTKLCIRDSLYRLARSAEQRHNCANQRGGSIDNRDASGGLMVDETNKCTEFIDMETDTNPIDRSIAHLLFHRPQDPSRVPTNDSFIS